jgi:amino-acid N-acetyltransferase
VPLRSARSDDAGSIERLLGGADLPVAGVAEGLGEFLVVEEDGEIVGAAGVERYGADALLRSVVVAPAARGRGVAKQLVDAALARAAGMGVGDVYLLTTTADGWFARAGFVPVDRDAVPAGIRGSAEFASICPATAAVMRRRAEPSTTTTRRHDDQGGAP